MPKSKRNQNFNLTKTSKKGRAGKEALVTQVQNAMDNYTYMYVFKVENMRNNFMKKVRNDWADDK
jgi:mRNA turnover protein 4